MQKNYQKVNKFPKYNNLTFEKARVTNIKNKILITLLIKANERTQREGTINYMCSVDIFIVLTTK